MLKVVFAIIILVYIKYINSYPINNNIENYLKKFGYLDNDDNAPRPMHKADAFRNAIKKLQKYANLPETGEVDENTIKLIQSPRCGMPDTDFIKSTSHHRQKRDIFNKHAKWTHNDLTWNLLNKTGEFFEHSRRVMNDALAKWSDHTELTFREENRDDADIKIGFYQGDHGDGYDYKFDGPAGVLAHAFYPIKKSSRKGWIHIDNEEQWELRRYLTDDKKIILYNVVLHEIGHVLGLAHSPDKNAIMYPYYNQNVNELGKDDINSIQKLYGKSTTKRPKSESKTTIHKTLPTTTPVTTTPVTTTPIITSTTSTYNKTSNQNHLHNIIFKGNVMININININNRTNNSELITNGFSKFIDILKNNAYQNIVTLNEADSIIHSSSNTISIPRVIMLLIIIKLILINYI